MKFVEWKLKNTITTQYFSLVFEIFKKKKKCVKSTITTMIFRSCLTVDETDAHGLLEWRATIGNGGWDWIHGVDKLSRSTS